jgi:NAD-dependent SIR2 family protein deacetylase
VVLGLKTNAFSMLHVLSKQTYFTHHLVTLSRENQHLEFDLFGKLFILNRHDIQSFTSFWFSNRILSSFDRTTNDSSRLYSSHGAWKQTTNSNGVRNKNSSKSKVHLVEEQPLGIWNEALWSQAKRETFRKDPLGWWNGFWLRYFPVDDYEGKYSPNAGHITLATLQQAFPDNVKIISQNIDGLHHSALLAFQEDREEAMRLSENIIEAHGRAGLYKCVPEEDSDTDSSDDEDDGRLVHLGHRRKYRAWKRRYKAQKKRASSQRRKPDPPGANEAPCAAVSTDVSSSSDHSSGTAKTCCRYQMLDSLTLDQLSPPSARKALRPGIPGYQKETRHLKTPPTCPSCGNKVLPQALLFDEGYHSHEHYQFVKMEDWLSAADVLVFVGTSFAVTLPLVALDHARDLSLPVYNFNLSDMLESTARLNAENIMGPSQETLPKLWEAVEWLQGSGVGDEKY